MISPDIALELVSLHFEEDKITMILFYATLGAVPDYSILDLSRFIGYEPRKHLN